MSWQERQQEVGGEEAGGGACGSHVRFFTAAGVAATLTVLLSHALML